MWRTYRRNVNVIARLCLGLVFVTAAVFKALDLNHFAERVGDFGLVYDALVVPTAWTIVLLELLAGIALMLHLRGSLAFSVGLLVLFIGVLTYGIALGLDVDCGCFGPAVHVGLETQLLTDVGLLLICALIYCSDHQRSRRFFAADGPQHHNTDTDL